MLAFGSMVQPALRAAEQLDLTVADMRFVKPLDEELIAELAATHQRLVCIEENAVQGGAGSAVLEVLAKQDGHLPVLLLGIEDIVTGHGDPAILLDDLGLSAEKLAARIETFAQSVS